MRTCIALAATAVLFSATASISQNQADAPSTPVFRSRANLVLVPTVVRDKAGTHVSGLKKEDFVVEQDGQAQPITVFEEVTPANVVRRAGAKNEFSNELSQDEPVRLTVIVVDMINTSFLDQAYARQQLLKFLSKRVEADEPTALYAIHLGGLSVIHDFTSDRPALIAALKEVGGKVTPNDRGRVPDKPEQGVYQQAQDAQLQANPQMAAVTNVNNFLAGAGLQLGQTDQLRSMEMTLNAFQQIAQRLEGVPGRKTMIWATAGFPYSVSSSAGLSSPQMRTFQTSSGSGAEAGTGNLPRMADTESVFNNGEIATVEPLYQRTLQMLATANIAVYPVDARGLVTFEGDAGSYSGRINDIQKDLFRQSLDTMNNFADITGGKAFYNRNDLDTAFKRAADDNDRYYLIGYVLPKSKKNDPWHKLKVKISRPNVEVRSRTGFMTEGKLNQKTAKELKRFEMQTALATLVEFTAVPLRVQFKGAQPAGEKRKVTFSLYLPPGAATISSEKNELNLDVAAVARSTQGKAGDQFSQTLAQPLKPEAMAVIAKEGIDYSNVLTLAPGDYTVHFVVRDNNSNKQGSLITPLRVQ